MADTPGWYYKSEAIKNWTSAIVPWFVAFLLFAWVGKAKEEASLATSQVDARVKTVTEPYAVKLAELESRLRESQSEREAIQLGQDRKPILSAWAEVRVAVGTYTDPAIEFVTLDVILENIGIAPIDLGLASVNVFEAAVNEDIALLLKVNKSGTNNYDVSADEVANEDQISEEEKQRLDDIRIKGRAFAVDFDDFEWTALKDFSKERKLDFRLEAGQKRTIQFQYILTQAVVPNWYRFEVTLKPPADDNAWLPQRIETILGGPGMPDIEIKVSKTVYETRTTGRESTPPDNGIPVPLPAED